MRAARWVVLPPGAAARSRTLSPGRVHQDPHRLGAGLLDVVKPGVEEGVGAGPGLLRVVKPLRAPGDGPEGPGGNPLKGIRGKLQGVDPEAVGAPSLREGLEEKGKLLPQELGHAGEEGLGQHPSTLARREESLKG